MESNIVSTEVQDFIFANTGADTERLVLRGSPFANLSAQELATQIDGRKRAETKLPTWFKTRGIVYPSRLSMEQCSSELTAAYKVQLIHGRTVVDLTGGFGVDCTIFSLAGFQTTHYELNADLSEMVAHNAGMLNTELKTVAGDSITWLKEQPGNFGTIYLDPSRRVNTRKVFMLADCEPNLPANLSLLNSKAKRILVKTSPLLDISAVIRELVYINEIHILSVKNDCKEVLYVIDRNSSEKDPKVVCGVFSQDGVRTLKFKLSEETQASEAKTSAPLQFLYEPDVALLKAGCFKLITKKYDLNKLHKHTHLYTSEQLNSDFPGRHFRVNSIWDFGELSRRSDIRKANIICRNFPIKADEVRKRLKIADGGDVYLVFCTDNTNNRIVIECTRLN